MFKKFVKTFKYGQKGFTLIELLVVVAILGILAAVAIPNVSKFVKSGTLSAANTEVATVQLAAAAFAADTQPTADFAASPTVLTLAAYLDKPIKGTYAFDTTGGLTGADYPNLDWSDTAKQFVAPAP